MHRWTRGLLACATGCFAITAVAALDSDLLHGLEARAIGPAAVGGRISAIDVVRSDPNRMVIGVATGGVWMTDNGGLTWRPVFDDQPVASIGAVAVNQANPDIIWVGTGEGNVRNSTSIGAGVFKSIDGGHTWARTGLADSERINRIALHPDDPDIAYVAALGTLWGPNEERGVFRTTDGGKNWQRILYVDDSTGATDIKMDPANPNKLIAGMWQFRRWPYRFESGGPGSGMYISHDGGASWERRTEEDGLPSGELGRMAFSFAASDPRRIYALVEAKKSALLRSDDGGRNWQKVNEDNDVADRPFYYTEIFADPTNADRVYNVATRVRVSLDGGKTFSENPVIDCCAPGNTVHIDNHAFWINPDDPRHLVVGNDGGVAISRDRGDTWRFVRNLPLAQFYHIRVDNEVPYNVYGGLQDNGSWRGPSEVWVPGGIRNLHWQEVGFGDGFDTIPDPENPLAGYAMSQGGFLFRYNLASGETQFIRPSPPTPEADLRFNWNSGFALDPFDPATIYYGSQFLHRSSDRGASWEAISPDLTSNDPELQGFRTSGGLTPDVTAAENFTSIVTVAPSPLTQGLLWIGTDDGRVHVTRDGGANWDRIDGRGRGVPDGAWVPMISPSPHDAGTAFVVFDDHRRSDMTPYVFRVEEYGRSWHRLAQDGMSGYALSVLQDPVDSQLLFVGTEFGLHLSVDGGDSWSRFTAGVPTVSVMDMAIQQREVDLVLGTHGRSVYVIDDYSGLRNLDESALEQRLAVLSATTGQHHENNPTASTRFTGSGEFRGDNPDYGVLVTFIASGDDLPHPDPEAERQRKISRRQAAPAADAGPEDEDTAGEPLKVEVTVRNAAGDPIRRFKREVHQGINRLAWDLAIDGVRPPPGPNPPEADADLPSGPHVPPGDYRITLKLEDQEVSIDVSTAADPRSTLSQKDFEDRFQAQVALMDLQESVVATLEVIDRARQDVDAISGLLTRHPRAAEDDIKALKKEASGVRDDLDELEEKFRSLPDTRGIVYTGDKVSSHLNLAQVYVASSPGAPTATATQQVRKAREAIETAVAEVNDFMADDLDELNRSVRDAGVEWLQTGGPIALP